MSVVKNRSFLCLLAVVLVSSLVVVSIGGCAKPVPEEAPVEKFTWRIQSSFPWATVFTSSLRDVFAPEVYEKSGGRLDVSVYAAGEVVPAVEVGPACRDGIIDMGMSVGAYWAETPATTCDVSLPFAWQFGNRREEFFPFLSESGIWDIISEEYADQNIYPIGPVFCGAQPTIFSTTPIHTMDDFQGLVIRSVGLSSNLLTELGASPTFLPSAEAYMALKLGTVDGSIGDELSGFWEYKWYEMVKAVHRPGFSDPTFVEVFVNMDAWNSLPEDIQNIVIEAVKHVSRETRTATELAEQRTDDEADKWGYEIIDWTGQPMLDEIGDVCVEKVWPVYAAKHRRCERIIQILKDYYGYE